MTSSRKTCSWTARAESSSPTLVCLGSASWSAAAWLRPRRGTWRHRSRRSRRSRRSSRRCPRRTGGAWCPSPRPGRLPARQGQRRATGRWSALQSLTAWAAWSSRRARRWRWPRCRSRPTRSRMRWSRPVRTATATLRARRADRGCPRPDRRARQTTFRSTRSPRARSPPSPRPVSHRSRAPKMSATTTRPTASRARPTTSHQRPSSDRALGLRSTGYGDALAGQDARAGGGGRHRARSGAHA